LVLLPLLLSCSTLSFCICLSSCQAILLECWPLLLLLLLLLVQQLGQQLLSPGDDRCHVSIAC
jgi:hypothetical protein